MTWGLCGAVCPALGYTASRWSGETQHPPAPVSEGGEGEKDTNALYDVHVHYYMYIHVHVHCTCNIHVHVQCTCT